MAPEMIYQGWTLENLTCHVTSPRYFDKDLVGINRADKNSNNAARSVVQSENFQGGATRRLRDLLHRNTLERGDDLSDE